jgi:acyl carrier protein
MGLDTIEFVLEAEQRFGLEIPDEDAAAIETVGQFSRYIHNRLVSRDSVAAADESAVFERVCDQLERQFRIDRRQVCRDSRFVKDLGLD